MKILRNLNIDPNRVVSEDQLLNLKGGEALITYCCYVYSDYSGLQQFCSENMELLEAWRDFWDVSYDVTCQRQMFA